MTRREKAASIRATKKCLSKCQQINDFVNPFFELNNYIMHGLHICCSDKAAKYCARAALNCCSAVIDLESEWYKVQELKTVTTIKFMAYFCNLHLVFSFVSFLVVRSLWFIIFATDYKLEH